MRPSRRRGSYFEARNSKMSTAREGTARDKSLHISPSTANPTKPRADMDSQQARGFYRIGITPKKKSATSTQTANDFFVKK